MKLDNVHKNELISLNIRLKEQINDVVKSLDDINELLNQCSIQSYYVVSIQDRISESKIRAEMASIRTDEFLEEIKQGEVSMSGFY